MDTESMKCKKKNILPIKFIAILGKKNTNHKEIEIHVSHNFVTSLALSIVVSFGILFWGLMSTSSGI